MRVAIVGAGTIYSSHAEAHQQLGQQLTAVADVDRPRAEGAAKQFGVRHVATDWRELIDREDVDVVDICTPPAFHREVAVAALANGKHVICEKPLAISVADCDAIMNAAERSSAKLLVVHQFRRLPFYLGMKWLLEEGHLGALHFARVQRYDPPPKHLVEQGVWGSWKLAGGGMLMTKAIHQLDMLLGLLGPAKCVQAMMGTFLCPIESEDHLSANIEFENGAIASLTLSGQPYGGYGQHFDLFGSKAAVGQPWHVRNIDGSDSSSLVGELQRRFAEPGLGPTSGWKFMVRRIGWKLGRDFFPDRPWNIHAPLFREFFRSLEAGGPVPVTGQDGRAAVELCAAIYSSALSGESVELPLDPSHRHYTGIHKDEYVAAR